MVIETLVVTSIVERNILESFFEEDEKTKVGGRGRTKTKSAIRDIEKNLESKEYKSQLLEKIKNQLDNLKQEERELNYLNNLNYFLGEEFQVFKKIKKGNIALAFPLFSSYSEKIKKKFTINRTEGAFIAIKFDYKPNLKDKKMEKGSGIIKFTTREPSCEEEISPYHRPEIYFKEQTDSDYKQTIKYSPYSSAGCLSWFIEPFLKNNWKTEIHNVYGEDIINKKETFGDNFMKVHKFDPTRLGIFLYRKYLPEKEFWKGTERTEWIEEKDPLLYQIPKTHLFANKIAMEELNGI